MPEPNIDATDFGNGFRTENGVGTFPTDWDVAPFGDYVRDWAVGPRFSSDCYNPKGEIATLRTTDMDNEGNIELSTMPRAHLPTPLFAGHFLENDDVVISRSGTIGITGIFHGYWQPVLPGAFLLRFRLNEDLLPQFLRYYMNSSDGCRRVQQFAAGGVQKNIRGAALLTMRIPVPDLAEQQRITEILDTAVAAIQKTEALIAKLKQMKAGLLHDLLTRGVDENDELRASEATEKDGWIPRSFFEVVTIVNGQVSPLAEPYRNWQLIAPDHINIGDGELIANRSALEQNAISGKYVVEAGDVVYSKIRPYLRKAVLAKSRALCSADMYPLRADDQTDPRFLHALILGEEFSRYASAVSMRSGFPKINREELAEYEFFMPPLAEQSRIADRIDAHSARIIHEGKYLAKLKNLKHALMHDLLTGKKRVHHTEVAAT